MICWKSSGLVSGHVRRNRMSFRPVVFPSFLFSFLPVAVRQRQFPEPGLLVSLDEPSFGQNIFSRRFPDITVCRGGVRINGLPTERLDRSFSTSISSTCSGSCTSSGVWCGRRREIHPDSHVMSLTWYYASSSSSVRSRISP